MRDREEIPQNSPRTVLSDLGEISYLKLQGVSHSRLILSDEAKVSFVYVGQNLDDLLADYWADRASVPPRFFKSTLDSYKRLIFSFLRSKPGRPGDAGQ